MAEEKRWLDIDHDALPAALQPFSRALSIHDRLPARFRPSDETPLCQCLAGSWPTVADLRALVEWAASHRAASNAKGAAEQ